MMYSNNKKAAQGVGTLIIFIALILVSAVAAAVLISTASSFQSKAFDVGRQAQEKITTAVEVVQVKVSDVSDGVINATTDPAVPGAGRYRPIGPSVANCAKKTDITLALHMRQASEQWLGPARLYLRHDL